METMAVSRREMIADCLSSAGPDKAAPILTCSNTFSYREGGLLSTVSIARRYVLPHGYCDDGDDDNAGCDSCLARVRES